MALLSHLLTAVTKTSLANSSCFMCVFKHLLIFVQALASHVVQGFTSGCTAAYRYITPRFRVDAP